MKENQSNNVRFRDDRHLRKLVSGTRKWMKTEGIEEQALDWEAIAREEEVRWWRERLQQALTQLANQSREFAKPIATRLRQLSEAAESQAEAALDVTLGAVGQMGRVLYESSAKACLKPDAFMEFRHLQPSPVRERSTLRTRGPGAAKKVSDEESTAIFASSIADGRVIAEAQTVTIEFLNLTCLLLVVLVPEDGDLNPRVAKAVMVNDHAKASFDNLPSGHYVISIYSLEED